MVTSETSVALLLTLVDMGLLIGLSYVFLLIRGYEPRLIQTLTALLGTGTLLQLLSLPLSLWLSEEQANKDLPVLLALLSLGIWVWSIVVVTHILQQALSVSRRQGLLYTLSYVILFIVISNWLHPTG